MASEIKERNALAELANELTWIEHILRDEGYGSYCEEVKKAQRIIAELAKVEDVDMLHNLEYVRVPNSYQCYDAVVKCRAIAEEGETRMAITVGNEHELSHQSPHPVVLDEDGLKKLHPEWFHATDYHWLDTSVEHDFWDNAFYKCDYDPIHGKYHMFAES